MNEHTTMPGTFAAQKKNGDIYYRASITYQNKHISLGSFSTQQTAHCAYLEAQTILNSPTTLSLTQYMNDHSQKILSHEKAICLFNFRDNGLYIKNPIYLKKNYFEYYYLPHEVYIFDIDDLFYYSEHKIMKRGGHLFVSDYGMQVTILSRYGIKSHAVPDRDYLFVNGNPHDLRYENIHVINAYYGVCLVAGSSDTYYEVRIHVNGNYMVGTYPTAEEAAIAYNKAVDVLHQSGCTKHFQTNYIEALSGRQYAELYSRIVISDKLYQLHF